MTNKQLKDKAIKIKGKDYVQVSDRVLYFNEQYENGSITAELLSPYDSDLIVMKAIITPDLSKPERIFTGYSQEKVGDGMINKTSALENAETSAVGRALAMMGIGVIESIASIDEINKATNRSNDVSSKFASPRQITWMRQEAQKATNYEHASDIDKWIKDVTGMMPNELPSKGVMGAISQIRDKLPHEEHIHEVVIKDIPEVINLDDIPY